jgi:hypothetical protein
MIRMPVWASDEAVCLTGRIGPMSLDRGKENASDGGPWLGVSPNPSCVVKRGVAGGGARRAREGCLKVGGVSSPGFSQPRWFPFSPGGGFFAPGGG